MTRHLYTALLLAAVPTTLAAQLPVSSARATGMANAYGAAARGYEAIAWNPALLGMPDRPGFSLNLLQFGIAAGNNSFTFSDFNKYKDDTLNTADKDSILLKVRDCPANSTLASCTSTRPLSIRMDAGATTPLSMTFGNFGVSLSGAGAIDASLSSDFIELALFGNVTRKGNGETYLGKGSAATGWGGATLALAYGKQLPVPIGTLAVGGTLKFTQGIGVFRAEDAGTSLQTSPNFVAVAGGQVLASDVGKNTSNGFGVGLDVGGVYDLKSGLRFGFTIENLVNTMSWKDASLIYSRKIYSLTQVGDQFQDATIADDSSVAYNPANPTQKALHDSLFAHGTFPTRVRGSVRYTSGMVTVVGGADLRLKSGLVSSDAQIISAGAEIVPLGILAIRAGLASNFEGGLTYAVGGGLKFGPVRFDTGLTSTGSGDRKGFQLALGMSVMN